jgi:hypothetical protein
MPFDKDKLKQIKDKLNIVGPGFCLEKWTNSRIYLHTGNTHSCHHPRPHFISIEEIAKSPSALHNTIYKKEQRRQMLEGQRPSECEYCWKVEDSNPNIFSDRHIASSRDHSIKDFDIITNSSWDKNHNPSFLEISFSNVCNFACAYCNPNLSSKWLGEIEQYGAYPTSANYNSLGGKIYLEKEDNPYVDAFWKWWPEVYPGLDTLRVTGGEPLLTKHTYKLIERISQVPNPKLNLSFNSNFGVDMTKFINAMSKITVGKDVNKIRIFTSNESHGLKSEYIRYGIDYNVWLSNIELVLEALPDINVGIMVTYNILAVSSFTMFLKDIKNITDRFGTNRVTMSIQYLRDPSFLDIRLLPKEWRSYLEESLDYIESNFNDPEAVEKFKQVIAYFDTEIEDKELKLQDLKMFIKEYDLRRKLNFSSVFPEYVKVL